MGLVQWTGVFISADVFAKVLIATLSFQNVRRHRCQIGQQQGRVQSNAHIETVFSCTRAAIAVPDFDGL